MNSIDPAWLAATEFIDCQHPAIQEFVATRVGAGDAAKDKALKLYYAVRDGIRYDPYSASMRRDALRASSTLEKRVGYCVNKALDFDGEHDSQMHPYNSANQRHMEYVRQRGEFDDLPYDELVADMVRLYPQLVAVSEGQAGDFDHESVLRPT